MTTAGTLDATINQAGLDDKPLFLVNVMKSGVSFSENANVTQAFWYDETGGSAGLLGSIDTTTNHAEPLQRAEFAFNGNPLYVTQPVATVTPYAWHLYFDFVGSGSDALGVQEIDSIVVLNHNFNAADSIVTRVDLMVTGPGASGATTVQTFTTTPFPTRLVWNWANTPTRTNYTDVDGISIRVATSSTFGSFVPKIGEVITGKRIQFSRKSIRPWSVDSLQVQQEQLISDAGQTYTFTKNRGQNVTEQSWQVTPTSDEVYTGINMLTQIRALRDQTQGYTFPFIYVENPFSDGNNPKYVRESGGKWDAIYTEPGLIDFALRTRELAPFVRAEQLGW